ncbi:hypothetical protein BDN70DRAFT_883660 [Pholiota conissans]|uniref:Uncharacterized protein n=1 Tax=Pholiota conissans TaxID=109636 RepID=A0A9P5YTC4_9AGAR|nr:hypothetical protein BDN70DRAFT_883660 [Pholiota conissans]
MNYYLDPNFTYTLLQRRGPNEVKWLERKIGILNVEALGFGENIRIPKTCFALVLDADQVRRSSGQFKRVATQEPVVFTMNRTSNDNEEGDYYVVEKSQLSTYGMELVTLYL